MTIPFTQYLEGGIRRRLFYDNAPDEIEKRADAFIETGGYFESESYQLERLPYMPIWVKTCWL